MYKNKKISISIPAYNEGKYLEKVISKIPDYVDFIIVTNDASKDDSKEILDTLSKKYKKLYVINFEENRGVGASIMSSHKKGVELGADIIVTIAGDDQMDLGQAPKLINAVIDNKIDYAKGNRLSNIKSLKGMPLLRILGNAFFTLIFWIFTGNLNTTDPLNGYTALSVDAYKKLDLKRIGQRYDFETTMLLELIRLKMQICNIAMPSVYADEVSDINIVKDSFYIITKIISWKVSLWKSWHFFSPEKVFMFVAFFAGLTLVFLIPPFQSPDEDVHYLRAAAVSDGEIFCKNGMVSVRTKYSKFLDSMEVLRIAHNKEQKFSITNLINYTDPYELLGDKYVGRRSILCYEFPIGYIGSVTGVKIADNLGFNTKIGFYLARVFTLLLAIFIIYKAIKIIPFGKKILTSVSLFPMTLNQISTITYDAILIPSAFLYTALIFYLYKNKEMIKKQKIKYYLLLTLLLSIILLIKISYLPLILLLLLLTIDSEVKFLSRIKFPLYIGLSVLLLLIVQKSAFNQTAYIQSELTNTSYQIGFVIRNPTRVLELFYNSFATYGPMYFFSTLGVLGWFDTKIGNINYLLIVILSSMYIFSEYKPSLSKKVLSLMLIISLSVLFLIFISLFVIFTKPGILRIDGVQGRYFIPTLPILVMSVYGMIKNYLSLKEFKISYLTYIIGIIAIYVMTFTAVFERFYSK